MRSEIFGRACASLISCPVLRRSAANAGGAPASSSGVPARSPRTNRRVGACVIARCLAFLPGRAPGRRALALIAHHHETIVAGFGAPRLARPAQHLAHRGAALVAREAVELLV